MSPTAACVLLACCLGLTWCGRDSRRNLDQWHTRLHELIRLWIETGGIETGGIETGGPANGGSQQQGSEHGSP